MSFRFSTFSRSNAGAACAEAMATGRPRVGQKVCRREDQALARNTTSNEAGRYGEPLFVGLDGADAQPVNESRSRQGFVDQVLSVLGPVLFYAGIRW